MSRNFPTWEQTQWDYEKGNLDEAAEHCLERGLVFDFLAHPSCLGVVDPECRTVEMLCELVAKHRERVELTDLETVAKSVR